MFRGDCCVWPEDLSEAGFIEFAQSQGILLLLAEHIELIEKHWPKSIHQTVVIANTAAVGLLEERRKTIQKLFRLLAQEKIKAVLFKGAANAYLIYPKPILRQHADIDILINQNDHTAVVMILAQIGFETDSIQPSQFGPYQSTATLKHKEKPDVLIDLHWKINNRLLLADTLSVDEAATNSLQIQEYGEQASGLNYHHALLAACIHEAGSLPIEREKLIGLYDVILLLRRLGQDGLESLLAQAKQKQISLICLDYINKAITIFGSEMDKEKFMPVVTSFEQPRSEPSAKLLKHNRSWLENQKLDWLAVEGVAGRLGFLVSKFLRKLIDQ